MTRELPEAVKDLIAARTGHYVYGVDPDYRIVHWDSRMDILTGVLSQLEVLAKAREMGILVG